MDGRERELTLGEIEQRLCAMVADYRGDRDDVESPWADASKAERTAYAGLLLRSRVSLLAEEIQRQRERQAEREVAS